MLIDLRSHILCQELGHYLNDEVCLHLHFELERGVAL